MKKTLSILALSLGLAACKSTSNDELTDNGAMALTLAGLYAFDNGGFDSRINSLPILNFVSKKVDMKLSPQDSVSVEDFACEGGGTFSMEGSAESISNSLSYELDVTFDNCSITSSYDSESYTFNGDYSIEGSFVTAGSDFTFEASVNASSLDIVGGTVDENNCKVDYDFEMTKEASEINVTISGKICGTSFNNTYSNSTSK